MFLVYHLMDLLKQDKIADQDWLKWFEKNMNIKLNGFNDLQDGVILCK